MAGVCRHGWNRCTRDRFGGRRVWIGCRAGTGAMRAVDFALENPATGESR